jgi:hypothetical protein
MADRECFLNAPILSEITAVTNPVATGTEIGLCQPWKGSPLPPLMHARSRGDQVFPVGIERAVHPGRFFVDDFYNRIHLIPPRIDVGNLTEKVVYDIEFFNAFLQNVYLDEITPYNTDGIVLSNIDVPKLIYALLSITAQVTLNLSGPAIIDGNFTFSFSIGPDLVLDIVGQRIIPFPISPNWTEPVTEELSYYTQIIESRDGTEQRIILRVKPRWRIKYSILENGIRVNLIESLLAGWGGRSYAVPIWFKKSKITLPVLGDESVIQCDTANRGFKKGDLCIIWLDAMTAEAHEIDTVGTNQLTFVYPVSQPFPYGYVIPARLCHLNGQMTSIGAVATNLIEAQVTFEADLPETIEPSPIPDTYDGLGIFPYGHDYTKPLTRSFIRSMNVYDSGLGIFNWDDRRGYPIDEFEIDDIMLMGLAEVEKFKGFVASVNAQAKAFYYRINEEQLLLSRRLDMGSNFMYIKNTSYGILEQHIKSRQTLVMYTTTGRLIFNITSYMATDQNDIMLFTDTSWQKSYEIEEVNQISFLVKVRLDQDDYVYKYNIDNVAVINVKLKGVIN